ncbi:MAG: hypothetical protein AAGF72_08790, partial [Pseudomonadota bacterium]
MAGDDFNAREWRVQARTAFRWLALMAQVVSLIFEKFWCPLLAESRRLRPRKATGYNACAGTFAAAHYSAIRLRA